jgi:phage shock protein A
MRETRYPVPVMPEAKDDHEQRLARLEHMLEELRVQTRELVRLTSEARTQARTTKEQSQQDRAGRQARARRSNGSRPKSKS